MQVPDKICYVFDMIQDTSNLVELYSLIILNNRDIVAYNSM